MGVYRRAQEFIGVYRRAERLIGIYMRAEEFCEYTGEHRSSRSIQESRGVTGVYKR